MSITARQVPVITDLTDPSAAVRAEWRRGARDMAPFALGYVPFALLVGASVARSPDPAAGWAGTWAIYGGSAHLTVLDLVTHGAGPALAIAAGVLINLRLLVYSAALAPLWAGTPWRWRMAAAAMVVDPVWMLVERRAQQAGPDRLRRAHYLGCGVTLGLTWLVAVTAGMAAGSAAHATAPLAVAIPLCLVAIVMPHLRTPGGWAAVAAAIAMALVTRSWPAGSGLLASMAVAAVAGLATARAEERP